MIQIIVLNVMMKLHVPSLQYFTSWVMSGLLVLSGCRGDAAVPSDDAWSSAFGGAGSRYCRLARRVTRRHRASQRPFLPRFACWLKMGTLDVMYVDLSSSTLTGRLFQIDSRFQHTCPWRGHTALDGTSKPSCAGWRIWRWLSNPQSEILHIEHVRYYTCQITERFYSAY